MMKTTPLLISFLIVPSLTSADLRPMDDSQMSDISGAGVGLVIQDMALESDANSRISVDFSDYNNLTLSDLDITGKGGGTFSVGNADDPMQLDVVEEALPANGGQPTDIVRLLLPNTADAIDMNAQIDYTFVDGFYEETGSYQSPHPINLAFNGLTFQDSKIELWGTENQGPGMAITIGGDIERVCIQENNAACPQVATDAGGKIIPVTPGIAAVTGIEIRNLELGNKYQPLMVRTIEQANTQIRVSSPTLKNPTKKNVTGGNVARSVLDGPTLEKLNNQYYRLGEVQYRDSAGAPVQTTIVPSLQFEIAPLTQELATQKYTNPETGEKYTAEEYRATLGSIKIKEIQLSKVNKNTNQVEAVVFSTDGLTNQSRTLETGGMTYDIGPNVIEIEGIDIQMLRFTSRDLLY